MALTVDQVYLLNCLSYMCPEQVSTIEEGQTVQEYCQTILNSSSLVGALEDGDFMTQAEIRQTCERIVNDPTLAEMSLAELSYSESGAVSFVAISEESSEAVVCFQGSVGDLDWMDNFQGGAMVETPEQRKALDWYNRVSDTLQQYDTITMTGHSKGGNKAKYITLMEEEGNIDRCISFDGQGFSDEFMSAHGDKVAQRQDKIVNYSNENDYVNLLLNDVGERYYIRSDEDSSLLAYHSLFSLSDTYSIEDNLVSQNPHLQKVDQALNSFLRSIPQEKKAAYLETLGTLATVVCNSKNGNQYVYSWTDVLGLMNLETVGMIKDVLVHLFSFYVADPFLDQLCDWLRETFPFMDWVITEVQKAVERGTGLDRMDNGDDIRIASSGGVSGAEKIVVETAALQQTAALLRTLGDDLSACGQELNSIAGGCMYTIAQHLIGFGLGSLLIRGMPIALNGSTSMVLHRIAASSEDIAQRCSELARAVQTVSEWFEETESQISGMVQ